MSFHKGYIYGVLICFLISAILIYYFYPKSVAKACNPVINLLGKCINEKHSIELLKKQNLEKPSFKYKYLFDQLENKNYSCPKTTYEILKLKNDEQKEYCLFKKYKTFLGIKDLKTEIRYDYLYELDDGVYDLTYKTDTMGFLTLAKKDNFDKIFDKEGNVIIFTNPKYNLNMQKIMFEDEILNYLTKYNLTFTINNNILNKNLSLDITKYCLEMNYPFLDPKIIGKETIKEIVYDLLVNRNYLNKINKKMNVFAVNVEYKNKLYKINICFGLDEFKNVFNNNTTNAKNIKELSKQLKGKNVLETAYNILKWVDKNIKYDDEKAKEIIEGKNPKLRTPEEVLKDKKGICSEYSMFIDAILLNENIIPYYIIIKYKNKDIDHAVAAIKYNGTYYILDQHLPLVDLEHYIVSSYVCNNESFKEIDIYQIDKNYEKKHIKKITKFDYSMKNEISLDQIKKILINLISKKYHLKFVKNLFKNKTYNVNKGIIKEFTFYCLYPKLGGKGLNYFDAKYLLDETEKELNKEFSVAKYFDINLIREKNNIKLKVSIGY